MNTRSNTAFDLAAMMIKQAKMLKKAGLVSEARALARRALDWHAFGQVDLRPVPVKVRSNRR